jgi:hypothetical protein
MTSEVENMFCRKIGDCLDMDCPCRYHFKRLISELYPAVRVILSNYMGFIKGFMFPFMFQEISYRS